MKHLVNEAGSFWYNEPALSPINRFCRIIVTCPALFEPVRGMNEEAGAALSREGFSLVPTVRKTTVFYDPQTDCFGKILHPLTWKDSFFFSWSTGAGPSMSSPKFSAPGA